MTISIRRNADLHGRSDQLNKVSTGVAGLDRITGGGLPAGRLVALAGGPGCGKTVLSLQVLVNRLKYHGEASVFISFEESPRKIRQNISAFDWGLEELDLSKIVMLEASGARLDAMSLLEMASETITQCGARNLVIDGLDIFLDGLPGEQTERSEIARIAEWIASRGVFCMVTMKGYGNTGREQTREVAMQYASDCVVQLGQTPVANVVTRTMRILKFRGSAFLADAFPIVISHHGIEMISSPPARPHYFSQGERIGSGITGLDELLGGGYQRGSCILVTGAPGTAKSSLAASVIDETCGRGEKVFVASFANQMIANIRSIGHKLEEHRESGLLQVMSLRFPRSPEEQFLAIRRHLENDRPRLLVIDPVTAMLGPNYPFAPMIIETLLDHAQASGVTMLCTAHTGGLDSIGPQSPVGTIATIADTWIHMAQSLGEKRRHRTLAVIKTRGSAHGDQIHELLFGAQGLTIRPIVEADDATG